MLRGAEPELGGEVGSGRGSWAVLPRCKERGPAGKWGVPGNPEEQWLGPGGSRVLAARSLAEERCV